VSPHTSLTSLDDTP